MDRQQPRPPWVVPDHPPKAAEESLTPSARGHPCWRLQTSQQAGPGGSEGDKGSGRGGPRLTPAEPPKLTCPHLELKIT